jgi:phage gp36-like protein
MAYSTLADIQKQLSSTDLVQLTDDSGAGVVDSDVVTRAIADADEMIDGYIGLRVGVPLTTVPSMVRMFSVELAIYNLYARRSDTIPDTRKTRYDNSMKLLLRIAEGKLSLGANDPEGNPPSKAGISYSGSDQVMTSDTLDRF